MAESIAAAWNRLSGHAVRPLSALFAGDPDRVARLSTRIELGEGQGGVLFDWSKTHLTSALLAEFAVLAEASQFDEMRRRLFAGEVVNPSEGRAAEHSALRGVGNPASVEEAEALRARMRLPQALVSRVSTNSRKEAWVWLSL